MGKKQLHAEKNMNQNVKTLTSLLVSLFACRLENSSSLNKQGGFGISGGLEVWTNCATTSSTNTK